MVTAIPTLSTKGWVSSIEEKGDHVLSWFITSEHSQTELYPNQVSSLAYLIRAYGHDSVLLQSEATDTLERLLMRNFNNNAVVRVSVEETDPDKPGHMTIRLNCTVREGGREHSLGRRISFVDGVLQEVVKINNG